MESIYTGRTRGALTAYEINDRRRREQAGTLERLAADRARAQEAQYGLHGQQLALEQRQAEQQTAAERQAMLDEEARGQKATEEQRTAESHGLKMKEAAKQEALDQEKEGFPTLVYDILTGKDTKDAIGLFNRQGEVKISDVKVMDDGGLEITRNGEKAIVKPHVVQGIMQRHWGINLSLPKADDTTTKKGKLSTLDIVSATNAAKKWLKFDSVVESEKVSATQRRAFAEALNDGSTLAEAAEMAGIPVKKTPSMEAYNEAKTAFETEMAKAKERKKNIFGKEKEAAGVITEAERARLQQMATELDILKEEAFADDLNQMVWNPETRRFVAADAAPEEGPAGPQNGPRDGSGPGGRGTMVVNGVQQDPRTGTLVGQSRGRPMDVSQADTNRNGMIDEGDADYARAKRIVDLMNSGDPTKVNALRQKYGERGLLMAEAIVNAVKKRTRAEAETIVGAPGSMMIQR